MNCITANCDKFTLSWGGTGTVLLGESGIVVSFKPFLGWNFSGSLTIEFEDENGVRIDFHAWRACRPRWPLEYGLNNAKEWSFVSSDPSYGRRGGLPSSQRVNETVRFHQLRLTVSSSGQWHGVHITVYAEQSHSTTG